MKIAHKGLILVAVPLVFEIAFVICLFQMLKSADQQAAELAISREVIICASELDKCLAFGAEALSSYKFTQSARLAKRYDDMVAQSQIYCARLSEIAKTRESIRQRVRSINQISSRLIQIATNFRHPDQSVTLMLGAKAASIGQLEHAYDELFVETQALTAEESSKLAGGSDSETRSRAMIYTVIGGALAFNVALTVALAFFFSKSITKRIGVLSENTKRLAQGKGLLSPVSGEDEIANLDGVFHRMAGELKETEQRKQDFVNMITHDLRTPLTSMRTVTATLAEGAKARQDEEDGQRVQVLERSMDRMINLVNDLLDIDKIDAGLLILDIESANFKNVLEAAVDSVKQLADQRGIAIKCEAEDAVIEMDSKRMGQVLVNLLANAIKYSPRRSTITVESAFDGNRLRVQVIDTGRGIPPEHIEHIFDRFKQVEASDSTVRGGSGLGLSITKALVELHGGSIGVKSNVEQGSTFWFQIPAKQSHKMPAGLKTK